MGGTSFDICLVRGAVPEIKTDLNWRYRYYIGLPMVDVQSVGRGRRLDRACGARVRCSSARTRPVRCPVRCVTAAAVTDRP